MNDYISALDTKIKKPHKINYIDTIESNNISDEISDNFNKGVLIFGLHAGTINKALRNVCDGSMRKEYTKHKELINQYNNLNITYIDKEANNDYNRNRLAKDNKLLKGKAIDLEYKINKLK